MTLVTLEDLSDRLLRPYSGMTDGQLRRGEGFRRDNPQGLFIGESGRVIERALDAGLRPVSVLVDERWLEHDRAILERIDRMWPDCRMFLASVAQFRELTGYEVVRGALACFERPKPREVADVLAGARRVAILEDITNYANMGAIFRSAAALGMDAVLVTPACHDPFYRRCARVSMGAVFQVPWARIGVSADDGGEGDDCDPERAEKGQESGGVPRRGAGSRDWAPALMPKLQAAGFTTVAMALRDDSIELRDPRLAVADKLAVVLGTEGDGLLDSTIESCDYTVLIPMAHQVDSLNVSVAAGIAFWELTR